MPFCSLQYDYYYSLFPFALHQVIIIWDRNLHSAQHNIWKVRIYRCLVDYHVFIYVVEDNGESILSHVHLMIEEHSISE